MFEQSFRPDSNALCENENKTKRKSNVFLKTNKKQKKQNKKNPIFVGFDCGLSLV